MSAGPGFILGRPPQTDDELYWLVKALWGVTIPRGKVCPEHCSPFQAFADAYFGRNSIDPESPINSIALWHGSRGLSGKSFMLSILGLTKAFMMGSDVNLLGGSFAQSANIHEHMRAALEHKNAPRYMLQDEGAQVMRLTNRARIRPLTASQRTVRGPHPPFLLLDEIDEMELAILDAALGQPMRQKNYLKEWVEPYTVMCSTWQNAQGTFTEIYRRADEQGIPKYTWCYKDTANPEDGWLTEKAIAEKKASIPVEMWRVEYELGEPSIGNRAFDSDAVERMFSLPFVLEDQFDEEGNLTKDKTVLRSKVAKDYEEYIFADPEHPGDYVIGADWAKEQDFTVITVIRTDRQSTHGMELVYYARLNRRPYPFMVKMFNDAMQRYNAQGEYDRTGLGNVVADYIDDRAHGFMMVGDKRASMLSEYVNAVERDVFKVPKIPTAYTAHKYAQVGDLYSNAKAQGFHLPDEVCALALAYHRAIKGGTPALPLVLQKGSESNRYAKHFETPPDRHAESAHDPVAGEVYQPEKSSRGRVSLLA